MRQTRSVRLNVCGSRLRFEHLTEAKRYALLYETQPRGVRKHVEARRLVVWPQDSELAISLSIVWDLVHVHILGQSSDDGIVAAQYMYSLSVKSSASDSLCSEHGGTREG